MNQLLSTTRLPAMPAAAARLVPLLGDPASDWTELEKLVRQDEALTVAVLRLANSARYGSPSARFDLRHGMMRIGRRTLRRCVLEQQVAPLTGGDNAAFDLQRGAMWRSALAGAIAAEELAASHCPEDSSLAFTCGLLRDIGKLVLNVRFGAEYLAVVSSHARRGGSFTEAEREALGFDHAQIGAALARQWTLPDRIAAAIECHHEPPPPGDGHSLLFDVVHAADTMCRWAGLGVGVDGLEYRLQEHVRKGLGLHRASAEREIAMIWEKLREAEELFDGSDVQGAAA